MPKLGISNSSDNAICLICKNPNATIVFEQRTKRLERNHYKCQICDCIFVPNKYHLNKTLQQQRYLEHNNDPSDARYRNFLSKATGIIATIFIITSISITVLSQQQISTKSVLEEVEEKQSSSEPEVPKSD